MKDILPLNPVLDLDVGYVFKMSDIVCDNSQPLAEGMTGNDHIELINTFAFHFKSIFDIAVVFGCIARQVKDYNLFNKFSDAYHFTKIVLFTLSISIESSIIKFMQRNGRHFSNPIVKSLLMTEGLLSISSMSMLVSSKYCLFFIVLVIYLAKAESMAVAEHFLHIVSGHIVAAR